MMCRRRTVVLNAPGECNSEDRDLKGECDAHGWLRANVNQRDDGRRVDAHARCPHGTHDGRSNDVNRGDGGANGEEAVVDGEAAACAGNTRTPCPPRTTLARKPRRECSLQICARFDVRRELSDLHDMAGTR